MSEKLTAGVVEINNSLTQSLWLTAQDWNPTADPIEFETTFISRSYKYKCLKVRTKERATYFLHARLPVVAGTDGIRRNVVLEVAVRKADKPPSESEDKPAEHEGKDKVEQIPAPLDVDERREDVGHVALATFLDVLARYVTLTVLKDETFVRSSNARGVVAAAALLELPQTAQIASPVQHRVRDRCSTLVPRRQEV